MHKFVKVQVLTLLNHSLVKSSHLPAGDAGLGFANECLPVMIFSNVDSLGQSGSDARVYAPPPTTC